MFKPFFILKVKFPILHLHAALRNPQPVLKKVRGPSCAICEFVIEQLNNILAENSTAVTKKLIVQNVYVVEMLVIQFLLNLMFLKLSELDCCTIAGSD